MIIDRRQALLGGTAVSLGSTLPKTALAEAAFAPSPGNWRSFEVTTTLSLPSPSGAAQAWVPIPSFKGDGWITPGETTWTIKAGQASIVSDTASNAAMVHARWQVGEAAEITVTSQFRSRDRSVSLQSQGGATLDATQRKHYTASTELLRLDGIAKDTAQRIVAGATTDVDKARRIYEWIVDITFRDPKTRGCGIGDIEAMLKTGNLSGKCADLNALYVGLARAAGLPARDIYGIRVAASAFGYKSLGANTATITKAQHCRAEVHLDGIGWFPVDPADVRKVVLEEPPANLAPTDPKVLAARKALFGSWETNWLAYNDAHDVKLPGSSGSTIPFFMYPQAETATGRLDSLDPDTFKYVITAKELTA
jgi:transglutaminase-like putative cysteine protease